MSSFIKGLLVGGAVVGIALFLYNKQKKSETTVLEEEIEG